MFFFLKIYLYSDQGKPDLMSFKWTFSKQLSNRTLRDLKVHSKIIYHPYVSNLSKHCVFKDHSKIIYHTHVSNLSKNSPVFASNFGQL